MSKRARMYLAAVIVLGGTFFGLIFLGRFLRQGEHKERISYVIRTLRLAGEFLKSNNSLSQITELPASVPSTVNLYTGQKGNFTQPTIDPFDYSMICRDCERADVSTYKQEFQVSGRRLKVLWASSQTAVLYSYGPDRDRDLPEPLGDASELESYRYDPTNGTSSSGDLFHVVQLGSSFEND